MLDTIQQKLKEIEVQHQVKILYACESGSRAWGFASPDSDFDVRFIYSRHIDDYLSISDKRDVVDLPVNEVLDISGWDIKKALKLFLKTNCPLYEWLQSPIIYIEDNPFASELRKLMPVYFSLRAGANHYYAMAYNTLTNDLQTAEVKLKRYFYALRPALACRWIIENRNVPPMEFAKLRTIINDSNIQHCIDKLMDLKQVSDEKHLTEPVNELNNWLEKLLSDCKDAISGIPVSHHEINELNSIFRKYTIK